MTMLFVLLFAHALADFPLQGDFLAKFKNPWLNGTPSPFNLPPERNQLWPWCMGAHCMIHAGAVFIITGSLAIGCLEFIAHALIDIDKCKGRISFGQDQALHILCKIAWVVLFKLGA